MWLERLQGDTKTLHNKKNASLQMLDEDNLFRALECSQEAAVQLEVYRYTSGDLGSVVPK